jgi:YidC/Oxa1 family membrane protein insertase
MDRNSIIGLLLMGLIMVAAVFINKPDQATLEKERLELVSKKRLADSLDAVKLANSVVSKENVPVGDSAKIDSITNQGNIEKFGVFANTVDGIRKTYTLENDLIKLNLSSKGGSVEEVILKNYKTWEKKPLVLFRPDSTVFNIGIPIQNKLIPTRELYFSDDTKLAVNQSSKNSITLRAEATNGNYLEFIYSLKPNSYLVDFKVNMTHLNQLINISTKTLPIDWAMNAIRQEKNLENERNNTTVYYKYVEEDVDKINPVSVEKEKTEGRTKWIGFKQQFFTSVLIAENSFEPEAEIETRPSGNPNTTKSLSASFEIPYKPASESAVNLQFYFGPNHYKTLSGVGFDLQKQIPLGWGIFGWVNKFIVIPVFAILSQFDLNFGLVILLLTLVIKTILFPFQFKSYMSQAKMRVLKPEIDDLNKTYENEDAMKKQQAMMALYKRAGVNPLGGCVPLLLQMPILFALLNFFPNAIELRQESFLWAEDLSAYDSIFDLPFNIPFYGDHISLFALLMTISTIIYTRMNNQLSGGNAQMAQLKWMMYLMPVVFLVFLNSYSAGLNYYYFLANVITFGQQFAFQKLVDEKKIHARIQENKNKPQVAKVSTFQKRLEEMAKKRGIQPPSK